MGGGEEGQGRKKKKRIGEKKREWKGGELGGEHRAMRKEEGKK